MRFWIPLLMLFGVSFSVHAQEQPQPTAVISAQIDAFKANDLDRAFSYASPTIKRLFGSAERFGRMVKQSYPMVWRPERVRFGVFTDRSGQPVQTVFFTDKAGSVFEASYHMLATDSGWQINGVFVRQAGVGA